MMKSEVSVNFEGAPEWVKAAGSPKARSFMEFENLLCFFPSGEKLLIASLFWLFLVSSLQQVSSQDVPPESASPVALRTVPLGGTGVVETGSFCSIGEGAVVVEDSGCCIAEGWEALELACICEVSTRAWGGFTCKINGQKIRNKISKILYNIKLQFNKFSFMFCYWIIVLSLTLRICWWFLSKLATLGLKGPFLEEVGCVDIGPELPTAVPVCCLWGASGVPEKAGLTSGPIKLNLFLTTWPWSFPFCNPWTKAAFLSMTFTSLLAWASCCWSLVLDPFPAASCGISVSL